MRLHLEISVPDDEIRALTRHLVLALEMQQAGMVGELNPAERFSVRILQALPPAEKERLQRLADKRRPCYDTGTTTRKPSS